MAAQTSLSVITEFASGTSLVFESPDPRARINTVVEAARARHAKTSRPVIIAVSSPALRNIIKEHKDVTKIKSRHSYLSLERLKKFQEKSFFEDHEISLLMKVMLWAEMTKTGDHAEITFVGKEHSAWEELSCHETDCSHDLKNCFAARAYAKIPDAKMLLVSHEFLFTQLFSPSPSLLDGEIKPNSIIIEETNLLEDLFTYTLTDSISFSKIRGRLTDAHAGGKDFDQCTTLAGLFFAKCASRDTLVITEELAASVEWKNFCAAMEMFCNRIKNIQSLAHEYKRLTALMEHHAYKRIRFLQKTPDGTLLWKSSPLSVGSLLETWLYDKTRTIMFSSGALTVNKSMAFMRAQLNVPESFREVQESSPLSAEFSVEPNTSFLENPGQTLMLFGSKRTLMAKFLDTAPKLKEKGFFVYAQDISGGKGKIIELFRRDPDHSLIFCTMNFWEKADLALLNIHTVILEKLLFDHPYDPVHSARAQKYLDEFQDYFLPRAILRLKELLERAMLLPSEQKRIILLDDAIIKKEYGKIVFNSLPAAIKA